MRSERRKAPSNPFRKPARWRAFAKLNEELRVFGMRADGYHEIRTVFRTIDLADEILVADSDAFRFSTNLGPQDETNLVVRAIRAFERRTGIDVRADVRVTKNIPVGAGLGGGSADAAVTLMGFSRWYEASLQASDLWELLVSLGADVPFFSLGGRALGAGHGECLFPIDVPIDEGHGERSDDGRYLLVHPPLTIRTEDAYRWLDEFRAGDASPSSRPKTAASLDSGLTETHEYTTILGFCARFVPTVGATEPGRESCLNDFELPLFQRFPELAEIKGRLLAEGAVTAAVSGSGATVFGRFHELERARRAARALGRQYVVSLVRPLGRREYFSRVFGNRAT